MSRLIVEKTDVERRLMEHDVGKLQELIVYAHCDDVSLATLEDDVGKVGTTEREAGEIELF